MLALHYAEYTRDVDESAYEELTLKSEAAYRRMLNDARIESAMVLELGARVVAQISIEQMR